MPTEENSSPQVAGSEYLTSSYEAIITPLIKSLPSAVIIFDKQLRFIAASDRFFQESPLNKEDVRQGDYWYDFVPDMPEKWKIIHQRCLQGESLKGDDDSFPRHSGNLEWWRWEIVPWYIHKSEIGGLILYVENVTQQKRAERKLKHLVHSLTHSNQDLSKFAHKCAHDLNQPLRTIANYIQLINSEFPSHIDDDLKKYFRAVLENTEYMRSLIVNILLNAQGKNKNPRRHHISMAEVLGRALLSLEETIHAKHAVVQTTPETMPIVQGDKISLTQVLQNLISNAIKYNDKSEPWVYISAKEEGNYWTFSVQDNGMGIDKKDQKRIFNESMRANRNNQLPGSGLGLYHCKQIIKNHGGKMAVKSVPGEGATFSFSLPKDEL